jgi:broad specificity phosphatase PhoE
MENMIILYFIRHGESVGNKENRFRGRYDFDLSNNGIIQAEALKEEISNIEFDFIYTSPLLRSKKTAQIISRDQVRVITDERLINVNLDSWENQLKENIRIKYPELWNIWLTVPEQLSFDGMETFAEVQKRSFQFVMELVSHHAKQTIAIVTHRAVLKPLFAALLGISGSYFWKIDIDTASYSIVEFRSQRGLTFTCINQNKHLKNYIREDLG